MHNDESGKTASCPITFSINLPIQRQVLLILGAVVLLLSLLSAAMPILVWLLALVGGVMIYASISGNCPLTKFLTSMCDKGGPCCAKE